MATSLSSALPTSSQDMKGRRFSKANTPTRDNRHFFRETGGEKKRKKRERKGCIVHVFS